MDETAEMDVTGGKAEMVKTDVMPAPSFLG